MQLASQSGRRHPCLGADAMQAMVFVWSYLTKGMRRYTLVQVAVNDLIIARGLRAYRLSCCGYIRFTVPGTPRAFGRAVYVIPLLPVILRARAWLPKGIDWFDNVFMKRSAPVTSLRDPDITRPALRVPG